MEDCLISESVLLAVEAGSHSRHPAMTLSQVASGRHIG
jgi:hypothetical protein